jgi:adenylate cyclase
LFNDIRNYSTITENLLPHQIVELLNCYFGEATEIIRRNEGFVDKYLGDGLMACFGGPVPTKDPAGDAVRAALEMIRALQDKVRPVLREANLPVFNAGIGIHVGKVVMGNIGSESRMDYTVIGDVVNVAARVESQTKEFGWAVIVTREAKRAAGEGFDYELVGTRRVKGREQPVEMYRVIDPTAPDMYRL